jgi:hypothetical protein
MWKQKMRRRRRSRRRRRRRIGVRTGVMEDSYL